MYARVIVDIPAKQTNRPFDYKVPEHLLPWVEIGSRVGVPFGPRVLQGFVIGLSGESELAPERMKPISEVLDLVPPLTPELVRLAGWISRTYMCHEITALQAMVPGALKAKYERSIRLADAYGEEHADRGASPLEGAEVLRFIGSRESVALQTVLEQFPKHGPLVKRMIREGVLIEEQKIKNRLSKKKVLTVFPPEQREQAAAFAYELPAQARRQKQVLQFMLEQDVPIRLTELMEQLEVGAGTVKALADKGWITMKSVEVFRDPYENRRFEQSERLAFTDEQQSVYDEVEKPLVDRQHQVYLLKGVTGSGKTEVYLQLIDKCLQLGREAIVLVPEISLTPQMVERFKGRFGDRVAVMHSRLSQGERYDEWRKIQTGQVQVAIGARSAVFAPFRQLGLIIIDEEHEGSYKQEESPKYHTREVAVERAKEHQGVVILGSATPSLESYYRATAGQGQAGQGYRLLQMPSRVKGRSMPPVKLIDMREELREGNRSMFSRSLFEAIEDRLRKQEQIVLFLNRRGYSTFIMCRSCGFVAQCPHCEISLTFHQRSRVLRCHYCGYAEPEPRTCPSCQSEHIRYFGTGTQKVEEQLGKLFPGIRVIRMDVDTTTEKGSHEKWLTMFRNKQADVLLGTQMVAKGLDFPDVTLVGVIAADTMLNLPDFRSGEKTFQLMTQVAGRAGRHQLPGEVIIQTYAPEHYSLVCAEHHDYEKFVQLELEQRKMREYPPYCRLILITISHEQVPLVVKVGEALAASLRNQAGAAEQRPAILPSGSYIMEILGPVASPIPRIKDRYRFQCMVKYDGNPEVLEWVERAVSHWDDTCRQEQLQISVDVDPYMLM